MSDLNHVFLIGRLTRDVDLKYLSNGTAISKFSLAVNEKRKSGDQWKDEPGFFEIVLWGKLGETLKQYLLKGKQVGITGRLTQERWEQDGAKRSRVIVTASAIQLLGGGNEDKQDSAIPDGFSDDIPF